MNAATPPCRPLLEVFMLEVPVLYFSSCLCHVASDPRRGDAGAGKGHDNCGLLPSDLGLPALSNNLGKEPFFSNSHLACFRRLSGKKVPICYS